MSAVEADDAAAEKLRFEVPRLLTWPAHLGLSSPASLAPQEELEFVQALANPHYLHCAPSPLLSAPSTTQHATR